MFLGFLFLLLSFFIFLLSKNILMFWISFFISTLASLLFLRLTNPHVLLKYMILQEISLIFILFGIMSSWLIFLLGIFLKVGSVPFHIWMINIIFYLEKFPLIWMLSLSKIIPLMLIINMFSKKFLFFIFILFIFNQLLIFFINLNIKSLLFLSSISNFFWFLFSSFFSILFSLFFLILYNLFINFLVLINDLEKKLEMILIFQLTGIPPSILFFLKVFILVLCFSMSVFYFLFLFLFDIILMMNYFKFIEKEVTSFENFKISKISKIFFLNLIFLFCLFLYFIF